MSDLTEDQGPAERPRVRVPARTESNRATQDSIVNFVARLGISTPNLLAASSYDFTPISRLQQLMEWAYRSSWVVGAAVDIPAEDMTRAGVQMNSETPPEQLEKLQRAMDELCLWQSLQETIKWSRLYGGALMAMMIDGQDMATPLIAERLEKGQLKGFISLDRWMTQPTFNVLVGKYGPDYGLPEYYDVVATAPFMPRQRIHYSRVVRMDGIMLPFRQRLAENGWGMSVIERLYDRLLAFDSGTMGAAQLLYKAYLRTYKVKGYRTLIGAGGELTEKFLKLMELMRMLQSNEGMTVIDSEDEFETHQYSFSGVSDTLLILGQQISGALGIPLVRLYGQSPVGLNSTGESDMKLYEAMIHATQEARLRRPLTRVFDVMWQSEFGKPPPDTWGYQFRPIRQLDEMERAELAQRDADTIKLLHDGGVISTTIALKELKQESMVSGRFTNITEEDIKDSEEAPPPWEQPEPGEGMAPPGGIFGGGGQQGGGPPGAKGGQAPDNPGGMGGVGFRLSSSPGGESSKDE
jgi:uncharacterized protein